jgi:site-specific DNA recombinase
VKEFVGLARKRAPSGRNLPRTFSKIESQVDDLVTAISEGMRSTTLQVRLEALEYERSEIVRRMSDPPPNPVRLHSNLADPYNIKVVALHGALQDEKIRDEALQIIRGVIDRKRGPSKPNSPPDF